MRQLGIVHPDRMGVVVHQVEASIVFTKPKVVTKSTTTPEMVLAAQTVRVAYDGRVLVAQGATGNAPVLNAQVYAVAGADIAEGYTFSHEGNKFRVTDVVPVAGGIHAMAQAIG